MSIGVGADPGLLAVSQHVT